MLRGLSGGGVRGCEGVNYKMRLIVIQRPSKVLICANGFGMPSS